MAVRSALEELGITITSTDITYLPQNLIELDKSEDARQVLAVMDALDDNDDVQGVYANFDISDAVLSELAAD
jgi:transcriptional/translational regulatory protein YebC/TACO1